jgi:DNA-binding transcriptional ArsR family regulator
MTQATRVMDLTRGRSRVPVEVHASVPVEMLVQLTAHESPESAGTYDDGSDLFDRVRTRASAELLTALTPGDGGVDWKPWGNLIGLALLPTPASTVAEFMERVEGVPADELWRMLAGDRVPILREMFGEDTIGRAAAGDASAREDMDRALRSLGDGTDGFPHVLERPAEEVKAWTLDVLTRWHREVFAPDEAVTEGVLRRDAGAKRSMQRGLTDEQFIERATNGLDFRRDAWTRRVILAPHVSMRPWNVMAAFDDAAIICYPVADESLGVDPDAPAASLVRLHKALGDERRLRILKTLTRGPATLQELADVVGLAKSTTHHHMVILRSAGLVRTTVEIDSRYSLRREAIPQASSMLAAFLDGGSG